MQLFTNNAISSLANPVSPTDTVIQLNDGSKFPNPGPTDTFKITIEEGSNFEIILCSGRTGNTITVAPGGRAQEGTTALGFSAGSRVGCRITAALLQYFFDQIDTFNSALALKAATTYVDDAVATKANIASPAFTGTPTAPTPSTGDDSSKVATTAFVQNQIAASMPGTTSPTQTTWIFTTPGFNNVNLPESASLISITMIGGGGAGGEGEVGNFDGYEFSGGGGGAGGCIIEYIAQVAGTGDDITTTPNMVPRSFGLYVGNGGLAASGTAGEHTVLSAITYTGSNPATLLSQAFMECEGGQPGKSGSDASNAGDGGAAGRFRKRTNFGAGSLGAWEPTQSSAGLSGWMSVSEGSTVGYGPVVGYTGRVKVGTDDGGGGGSSPIVGSAGGRGGAGLSTTPAERQGSYGIRGGGGGGGAQGATVISGGNGGHGYIKIEVVGFV